MGLSNQERKQVADLCRRISAKANAAAIDVKRIEHPIEEVGAQMAEIQALTVEVVRAIFRGEISAE